MKPKRVRTRTAWLLIVLTLTTVAAIVRPKEGRFEINNNSLTNNHDAFGFTSNTWSEPFEYQAIGSFYGRGTRIYSPTIFERQQHGEE